MPLKLNENEREAIQKLYETMKSDFKVKKLFLFGSKARGDAGEYSDLDLLILTDKQREWKDRYRLSDISADINVDYGVAMSCLYYNIDDWESGEAINPLLKANVDREGIELVL